MSAPSISLKPGQIVVTLLTSAASTINGKGILSGTIVSVYNNQGAYAVGDTVSFKDASSFQFTNGDDNVPYSLIDQNDVLFKVNLIS